MKKLISLLLCAAMLFAFAGCAEPVPETQPTEEPTQPVVEVTVSDETVPGKYESVELQYWSLLAEEDPEAAVLRQAAAVFEKTTGTRLTMNWMAGDWNGLQEKLAENAADIFEIPGSSLQDGFLQYGLDLEEFAFDYEAHSWEVLRSQIMDRCGSLKALAYRPRLYGMYYNRDTFDDLGIEATPSAWAEYLEFSQWLKDRGYEVLTIDVERANLLLELHMERTLGWEGLKETMVNAQWRKNEAAKTMIQEAIAFASMDYVVSGTPATYPEGQNRLAQSNAVLVAGSNELCAEVEDSCMTDLNWGVFPYPGDGPGTGLLVDADVLMISAGCKAPEAAYAFVTLLTTGEFDQLRADLTEGIPADPGNASPIAGANTCMASATARAPKWFADEENVLFSRLWNGWYKTGIYFADQLNKLSRNFEHEKSVG